MKKLIFILVFLPACLLSCHKPVKGKTIPRDLLLQHVMTELLDSNCNVLEIKDELLMLLDTMQQYATYYPQEEIRIWAKSVTFVLGNLTICDESCTPEERSFYHDTLALRLADIEGVWYRTPKEQLAIGDSNAVVVSTLSTDYLLYDENMTSHILRLLYYQHEDDESMVFVLPNDSYGTATIMFSDQLDGTLIDSIKFNQDNCLERITKADAGYSGMAFGKDLIDAMRQHMWMFVAYVDSDESKPIGDRIHSYQILLSYFQEAYNNLSAE